MKLLRRVLLPLALLALVWALPVASAQAAADENTMDACEADNTVPALELVCFVTVALHLREVLGEDGELITGIWIGLLGVALVVWVLILLWRILPRRILRLKVAERMAELAPGSPATYMMTVENRRKRRPVEVELSVTRPPKGWSASLAVERPLPSGFKELLGEDDSMRVPLSARKVGANVANVRLTLRAPDDAVASELMEIEVSAIPYIKDEPRVRRSKEARLKASVKSRTSHAVIESVSHEPDVFRVHDDITTTVIIKNRGDDETQPLPVVLEANGKEVGRETVAIPPGAEACIEFPWVVEDPQTRVRVSIAA